MHVYVGAHPGVYHVERQHKNLRLTNQERKHLNERVNGAWLDWEREPCDTYDDELARCATAEAVVGVVRVIRQEIQVADDHDDGEDERGRQKEWINKRHL